MTYQEAVALKSTLPKTKKDQHLICKAFITPQDGDDFSEYCKQLGNIVNDLTDDRALQFSKNNNFLVRWMCRPGISGDLLWKIVKVDR